MNVVGISAHFHDSACCLLRDGKLVAAVEEERLTRIKHDPAIPSRSYRYCLQQAGLDPQDINAIAYFENPLKKLGRQLWMAEQRLRAGRQIDTVRLNADFVEREIRRNLGFEGQILFFDHHQSHAAGSYYFSGFEDAAILTVDGVGEWATTTYGRGKGSSLELFSEVEFPNSLGLLYSTITSYLGFEINDAEYKVMGLAPYGKPIFIDEMRTLIQSDDGPGYTLNSKYFDFIAGDQMYSSRFPELFGQPVRAAESEIGQFHKDVARSLQLFLEEILLEKCRYLKSQVSSENLCLSGGVALNCVANGRIRRDGPFRNIFIQPAASDAGSALGAAALAHVQLTGERPHHATMRHVYLGPEVSDTEIEKFLRDSGVAARRFGTESDLIQETALRLKDQQAIGWFQGRSEFGPRALGGRSILADPRNADMRDRINALVKKRESFRPFAPSVLSEKATQHFDLKNPSPFMLETCMVTSSLALPAITHVDGSARVQTVSFEDSPLYAQLISEFDRLTGCPILLNTSFNLRGDPIVQTAYDAFWCFVRSDLDALCMGRWIVERAMIPAHWLGLREKYEKNRARNMAISGISHRVYTFF